MKWLGVGRRQEGDMSTMCESSEVRAATDDSSVARRDTEPPPAPAAVEGPAARFGRSLAVVIGIDVYGDGIAPLRSAVADAKAVAAVLQRDHGFETWCLFDDDARLPRLVTLLGKELPAALGPDDRLLFYFAGHGIACSGDLGPASYLVPAHARGSDPAGFLPMHVVHDELAKLPVRHAFLILDCCFAGTFRLASFRELEPSAARLYRERYDRYIESPAWQVLVSTSQRQLALDAFADDRGEDGDNHSPFALALLEGLRGAADYTKDGIITADELAIYVRERVASAAESVGHRQMPEIFSLAKQDGGQFVFQVQDRPLALAPAPPLGDDTDPYRGLQSFDVQDHDLFFGREAVTKQLVNAVRSRQLTVVSGPSACGKSSLVRAGLVPALRAQGWTILPVLRVGYAPLPILDAWARELGGVPAAHDPSTSWAAAISALSVARPDQPCLLIVDQLEELIDRRTAARDRRAFFDALAFALKTAPTLHLVVVVRSDAELRLRESALEPWWVMARFAVPQMTRDQLRQLIKNPATAAVLHFEPSSLVERLIDDVVSTPAPLPLLSSTLSELYRRCQQRWQDGTCDRTLRGTDYEAMGKLAQALIKRATALTSELVRRDAAYEFTIRNLFTRMVTPGSGGPAPRRVPRHELIHDDLAEDRRVDEVLQRFHEARLISLGTAPADAAGIKAYVEPIHEGLMRKWPKVREWLAELDTVPETRTLLATLGSVVRPWQAHGQADSYLWSDPRIERLRAFKRAHPFAFNAAETSFVVRSVRLRRGRRARSTASWLALLCLLVMTFELALWSREAMEQQLFVTVGVKPPQPSDPPPPAPPKGDTSISSGGSPALPAPPIPQPGSLRRWAASADGQFLVRDRGGYRGGNVIIEDTITGHHLTLDTPSAGARFAFSPDGKRLVIASSDGTARVWDTTTGHPLSSSIAHRGGVEHAAFSPDSTRIVTAGADKIVRVSDAETGEELVSFVHPGNIEGLDFIAFGEHLLIENDDGSMTECAVEPEPSCRPPEPANVVGMSAVSPDGTRKIVATGDHARILDAITGEPLSPPLVHQGAITSVAFSPDGTRVVTASEDHTARVWEVTTGIAMLPALEHPEVVMIAAFGPGGTTVVTVSEDLMRRVWDVTTGELLSSLPLPPIDEEVPTEEEVLEEEEPWGKGRGPGGRPDPASP